MLWKIYNGLYDIWRTWLNDMLFVNLFSWKKNMRFTSIVFEELGYLAYRSDKLTKFCYNINTRVSMCFTDWISLSTETGRIAAKNSYPSRVNRRGMGRNHPILLFSTAKSPRPNWQASLWSSRTCHPVIIEWIPTEALRTRSSLPICHYRKFVPSWQVKDVSNEKSHPESLREPPWHGGRLHWLETGCTSNFCNEIPQTPPTAIQNGGKGRGWREEVGRDGSRKFSERLYRELRV